MKRILLRKIFLFGLAVFSIGGCNELDNILHPETPHTAYLSTLNSTGLSETALGSKWILKSKQVLKDSLIVTIPYSEKGYFFEDEVNAYSFGFKALRGEKLLISATEDSASNSLLFMDLFYKSDTLEHVAAADENETYIEHIVKREGEYLLRLQPELLKEIHYHLTITKDASVGFPVSGKDAAAVRSFWGDPRDGGAREHKGVDIFAPRGTPVLSASKGVVSRTGNTRIGGNIVWVADFNKSYYYAHLDSTAVGTGRLVFPGDTLGFVGNTGNAINTPPHLHFGIYYHNEGAVNPFPYINDLYKEAKMITAADRVGQKISLTGNQFRVYSSPVKANRFFRIVKNEKIKIYGGTNDYYRIESVNGVKGYVASSALNKISID